MTESSWPFIACPPGYAACYSPINKGLDMKAQHMTLSSRHMSNEVARVPLVSAPIGWPNMTGVQVATGALAIWRWEEPEACSAVSCAPVTAITIAPNVGLWRSLTTADACLVFGLKAEPWPTLTTTVRLQQHIASQTPWAETNRLWNQKWLWKLRKYKLNTVYVVVATCRELDPIEALSYL